MVRMILRIKEAFVIHFKNKMCGQSEQNEINKIKTLLGLLSNI